MSATIASAPPAVSAAVEGAQRRILRAEGLALFAAAAGAYAHYGLGWGLFAALFLAPDLSIFAYLGGPKFGAAAYNALHTTIFPLALSALGLATPTPALALGLIWLAHIGFDRALGYGLKSASGFRDTHLGAPGRSREG
jgi:hypothetical protein